MDVTVEGSMIFGWPTQHTNPLQVHVNRAEQEQASVEKTVGYTIT